MPPVQRRHDERHRRSEKIRLQDPAHEAHPWPAGRALRLDVPAAHADGMRRRGGRHARPRRIPARRRDDHDAPFVQGPDERGDLAAIAPPVGIVPERADDDTDPEGSPPREEPAEGAHDRLPRDTMSDTHLDQHDPRARGRGDEAASVTVSGREQHRARPVLGEEPRIAVTERHDAAARRVAARDDAARRQVGMLHETDVENRDGRMQQERGVYCCLFTLLSYSKNFMA